MNIRHLASAFVLASAAVACGAANDTTASSGAADTTADADAGAGFAWPVPAHWGQESDPFPLSFAPELPYQGSLELRFMPSFFTPAAPTYFTYTYAWLLEGASPTTAAQLSQDLTTYYTGLAKDADPTHFDPSVHHAAMADAGDGHFLGTVDTQDGFNAGVALHLFADVQLSSCGGQPVLLFAISPHAFDDATWKSLLAERASFQCTR